MFKNVEHKDGNSYLKRSVKGFLYAECKPYDSACIVNAVALKGSQIILPSFSREQELSVEDYSAAVHQRIVKVCQIHIHSVVLLPSLKLLPRNFIQMNAAGEPVFDSSSIESKCRDIEYAHSSKGDLYIRNSSKGCQAKDAFPFYLNISDVLLTAVSRA